MKISVTLPNYNHGRYLAQNIESLQAQSYRDWELLIVDDGSTDDSWDIIERYRSQDPRIRPDRFPKNRGAAAAMKRCMEMAEGDLLYASSSDDYIANPDFFLRAINALTQYPAAAGAFGRARVIDADNSKELWYLGSATAKSGLLRPAQVVELFFASTLFIPGISAIWHRTLIEKVGGYDPELGPQSDYYVNHALAMLHGVFYMNEIMAVARNVPGSYSQMAGDEEFLIRHAMVEKRFRALGERVRLRDEDVLKWRRRVIDERLSVDRQMRLVNLYEETFANIKEWERLLPEFLESAEFLRDRCNSIRQQLEAAKTSAEKAFDEIAGPLRTQPSLRSGSRPFVRRIARALARRLARFPGEV